MIFKGTAKRIDDVDLPRIASRIGVGEDEIHAVLDVETSGGGFDKSGRPKMLFEPHIFYKNLSGAQRDDAVRKGLAYPEWKRDYPKDSYPRLEEAMKINKDAALRSASWGLGQIMGFNAGLAGYPSAEAMVSAFLDDEEHHLNAMVTFIINAGLDDELRRHDWTGFARGYNGSGYARNGYHTKLADAYAKWAKIRDTPWQPERTPAQPQVAPVAHVNETPETSTRPAPHVNAPIGVGSELTPQAAKKPGVAQALVALVAAVSIWAASQVQAVRDALPDWLVNLF